MSAHTPGPWELEVEAVGQSVVSRSGGDLQYVAQEVRDRDAEFIVRACNAHNELIEALETLASQYAQEMLNSHRRNVLTDGNPYFEKARAAIAKARGAK